MDEALQTIHEDTVENNLSEKDVEMFNPLALAFIGDSIYDVYIRSFLIARGSRQVNKIHKEAIAFVKAKAQAQVLIDLDDFFTEGEKEVIRRGRNAKSHTIPKNADIMDYKNATGLEALIGFLYLKGEITRLAQIMNVIIERA